MKRYRKKASDGDRSFGVGVRSLERILFFGGGSGDPVIIFGCGHEREFLRLWADDGN